MTCMKVDVSLCQAGLCRCHVLKSSSLSLFKVDDNQEVGARPDVLERRIPVIIAARILM